jgi:hypothetical protein
MSEVTLEKNPVGLNPPSHWGSNHSPFLKLKTPFFAGEITIFAGELAMFCC